MKRVLAMGFAALLLTACAAAGQAPGAPSAPPESPASVSASEPDPPESSSSEPVSLPEDSSSQPGEPAPAPAPDGLPLPPQGEVNPDLGFGDNAPDFGNEDYAAAVIRRADPLWEALEPALAAIREDYSDFDVWVEDGSLMVVLEIGVIHEDKVDRFLEDWTGPAWDRLVKRQGRWSVAEQEAFAADVAALDLGPGVTIQAERTRGVGESVLVTVWLEGSEDDPPDRRDSLLQKIKDFARERNVPEDLVDCMSVFPRDAASGNHPD